MLKTERQSLILREVNIHNKVLLADISAKFDVSYDTARRDLQELAQAGKVIKVRGGALSTSYHVYSYQEHDIYAYQEKTIIARKAVSLLQDGMLVLISGGSTNLEVARILPPELKATFVTPSLSTAMQLQEHKQIDTILLGGRLSKSAGISVGAKVVADLYELRADICFVGTNAIDTQFGLTDSDWEVVHVKKAMMQSAKQKVCLAISEKLNTTQKIQIAPLSQVDTLITELDVAHPSLEGFRSLRLL